MVWGISMVVLLTLMASFNSPIADQYGYIGDSHSMGLINHSIHLYTTTNGRILQTFTQGVFYRLFGDMGAQVIGPIFLLTMFVLVFSWLVFQIFNFKKHQYVYSMIIGSLFAGGVLFTTFCLFDTYLWLDAAFIYTLSLVTIVYDVSLYIHLVRNHQNIKKNLPSTTILLLVALLLQNTSEISLVFTLGWSFVALIATCVRKEWNKYRKVSLLFFIVLLAGSLITILAPGLWSRAGTATDNTNILELIVLRPLRSYQILFSDIAIWQVLLAILSGIVAGIIFPKTVKLKHLKYSIPFSIIFTISATFIPMAVYFYGSHSQGVESRVLTVPRMGIYCGFILLIMGPIAYLYQKYKNNQYVYTFSIILLVALSIITSIGFFEFNHGYVSALAARSQLVAIREREIKKFKNGEISTLVVPDAPIMIKASGATDFTLNGYTIIPWFRNESIAKYYRIDQNSINVYGEKQPLMESWYEPSGRNACVDSNSVILERYYCENEGA